MTDKSRAASINDVVNETSNRRGFLRRAWKCDTLNVAPGERWDVIVNCKAPGTWAFHCHILPHAESDHGMLGMVTAVIVG